MVNEGEAIFEVIRLSREGQPLMDKKGWSDADIVAKITEEVGEFSEAVQIDRGILTNKTNPYDAVVKEAADVMGCIIDLVQRRYPDRNAHEVHALISHYIIKNAEKWLHSLKEEME